MPNIAIPLGISVVAKASIRNLRKRAIKRAEVVAAGQPGLAFLTNSNFAEVSPLVIVDGNFTVEGPIPVDPQRPLPFGGDGEDVVRQDEAEEFAVQQVLAMVTVSSQVLNEVANLMATSPNVKQDIEAYEEKNRVDTGPARTFVYQKQANFDVAVDGELVPFNSHAVRTVAPMGDQVHVLFTPVQPKSEGLTLKGRVDATRGDKRKIGVQSGGVHNFRFGLLEPWQASLIQAAVYLQKHILVTSDEANSTCSLNPLPNSVVTVHNWAELLEMVLTEFSKVARKMQGAAQAPVAPTDQ
jgi:hypothetical protein